MQRPSVIAVFCEDLREEKSGADIIIGIFPDNVSVLGAGPQVMPKLCVYTRLHVPVDFKVTSDVTVYLVGFEGKEVAQLALFDRAGIETTQTDVRAKGGFLAGFISRAVMSPFPVPHSARIYVRARMEGEDVVCGSLNISLNDASAP